MNSKVEFSNNQNEVKSYGTYPTDIKLYEKIRIIGQGAFGNVRK